MNASNASEASCGFTPTPPTVDLYKNDDRSADDEQMAAESELFRILATIIMLVSWVYLIVKAYIDYEANRAEFLDMELRNELEGDNGLHDAFNNANDLDPDHANDVPAIGPVLLQPNADAAAHEAPNAASSAAAAASLVARQTSPDRRRRQRSSDVTSVASSDLDDASSDDARVAESSVQQHQAGTDVAAEKAKNNPLRHVRKYARVLNPEDSRSREPETSDEDHAPSNDRLKPEAANAHAPAVAIATQTETLPLVSSNDASTAAAVEECDAGTQTTPDVPALQLEQKLTDCQVVINSELEQPLLANDPKPDAPETELVHKEPSDDDCQGIPPLNFQQLSLEKDPPTSLLGSQLERQRGPTRIAALNRHGTIFDEDLIAKASAARTKRNALGAMERDDDAKINALGAVARDDDSKTPYPSSSSSPSHRIIDSLNASLLDQMANDLAQRMAAQEISDVTLLRQELESQSRARRESQRTYAGVVQQVKWFGLGWESARQEAEKESEDESQRREAEKENEEESQKKQGSGQTILDGSDREEDARQGKTAADAPSDEQIVRDPYWWKLKKEN